MPGAFTPPHLLQRPPAGLCGQGREIKAKGVDAIICMSVNDVFVMNAWGKAQNAEELVMLADGNGEFTKTVGLDGSGFQMGTRSQRFALIANDGVVELVNVDAKGLDVSSAETILAAL